MHGARMESGEIPLHLEIGGEMSELNVPVKGISRRSFLKTTAAVAGAAAVSGATMTALAATDEETAGDGSMRSFASSVATAKAIVRWLPRFAKAKW